MHSYSDAPCLLVLAAVGLLMPASQLRLVVAAIIATVFTGL
mgnify:FL=1